ncbi:MAG TPA: DUF6077 domain-containing protein [Jatrophihabitantaceae bacterium]|nr:DUF6077 domain-containing protein [Jatrophihabitantaceae bacterium]
MSTSISDRPAPAAAPPGWTHGAALVTRALDYLIDAVVVAFADWTVLYHLGLLAKLHTDVLLLLWVVTTAVALWTLGRIRGGADEKPVSPSEPVAADNSVRSSVLSALGNVSVPLVGASVLLAAVSAGLVMSGTNSLWWPGWLAGAASVVVALLAVLRAARDATTGTRGLDLATVSPAGTLLALGSGLGLGLFSLFTLRSDPDDTFYVNRAAWVANHGTIPTHDTMFSDQTLPAIRGAGVPVQSIETFQGAIAHVFHLAAGTAAYLVTPPVGTFLAVWALWRLVRAWAPRRLALCFALGLVYLLWAGTTGANLGVFFLARMQQGKVVFVAMMVPLLYVYLTEWIAKPSRRHAALLFAGGVTAVGLTSSATFLVPIICAAVALPVLLQRRYLIALGAFVPFVYPAVVGLVVHFSNSSVDPNGKVWDGQGMVHFVFGTHVFGAIGWLAALAAVWFVRPGAPRLAVAGASAMLLVVAGPGILSLMNDLTGAHAVLWRAVWVAPLPALVGMAAALPLPADIRWAAPLPALVGIAAVVAAGQLLWAPARSVSITSSPTWRYNAQALHQARQILDMHRGPGPVLAPDTTMRALTLTTTTVHAIDPLYAYVLLLDEPAAQHRARILLSRMIEGKSPMPSAAAVRAALSELKVSMVCVKPGWTERTALAKSAGYTRATSISGETCLLPG